MMLMAHARKTVFLGLAFLLTLFGAIPGPAQETTGVPVIKPIADIEKEALETGATGAKRDFKQDALQVVDLGQYVTRTETGQEQEALILVAEGQRVFCSVPFCPFNPSSVNYKKPLADNVQYRWVTMKDSVKYYDDGSHGDILANDGLPSNIQNFTGVYICPYCYRHMVYLENLRERAKWKDFWSARQELRQPLIEERPTTFFVGTQVACLDPEDLSPSNKANPMRNYYVLDQERKDFIQKYEGDVIALYKKPLDVGYMDYSLYPDQSRRPPAQIPAPQLGTGTGPGGTRPGVPQGQNVPPYGQTPYGQTPYGQTPYGQTPYGQTPYGQTPYGQTPYGQTPYGQTPYGQVPYGQTPYGQVPYGQSPRTPGR
jgi:hypothetical protein